MKNNIFNDEDIAKYFAGELDERKIETMEKQLMNDSDKEHEMSEFAKLWEKSTSVGKYDKIDIDSDWQNVRQRMGFQSKSRVIPLRRIIYAVAAIFILLIGTAVVLKLMQKSSNSNSTSNEYIQFAANDLQKEVLLPDSTIILLNRNANIVYNNNYGKSNRDIALTGEAFFKVHKNKNLPFRVYTEGSTIEVLGTSFNIKPSSKEIIVSVVTGHVAFFESSKKENRVELLKDQQTKYKPSNHSFDPVKALDPNLMAWRTHKLYLNRYTPIQAFEAVANYFQVKLIVEKQLNFTEKGLKGHINVGTPDSAFKFLHSAITSQEFEYTINDNELIISTKK